MGHKIEYLLLDLGGLLVELNMEKAQAGWFDPALSREENWRQWLGSTDSQALERGEVSAQEFARLFIDRNNLNSTVPRFLDSFRSWVIGFYPEIFPLLDRVSTDVSLGVFSNITEIHWPPLEQELRARTRTSHYFASYLIGRAKPDPDAYRFVCTAMGARPESVLFIDDNQINVDGARKAGLHAEQADGPVVLEAILDRYSLLV